MKKVICYSILASGIHTCAYAEIGKKDVETVIADLMQEGGSSFSIGEVDEDGKRAGKFESIREEEMNQAFELVEKRNSKLIKDAKAKGIKARAKANKK